MKNAWLIANSSSSTTDADVIEDAKARLRDAGFDLTRAFDLANDELPDIPDGAPEVVIALGGDGTAHAAIDRYGTENGPAILVLPGGTMNLMAARLHGDADVAQVAERARAGRVVTLPLIEGPGICSLVGIIAGATAHWGDVRESLRHGAVNELIEKIPAAIEATFDGPRVRLAGKSSDYAALFVAPHDDGLHVHEIKAESVGDLIGHGWAWLNRDFLGGPTEELTESRFVRIESDDGDISLLVDGEREEAKSPLELRLARCPARFLATIETARDSG